MGSPFQKKHLGLIEIENITRLNLENSFCTPDIIRILNRIICLEFNLEYIHIINLKSTNTTQLFIFK